MKQRDLENEFEKMFENYGKMLYKIAFLYLGNKVDAEDVLQDVFIKYLNVKQKFKSSEHEKAWFIRVTQNKCKDFMRSSSRKNIDYEDIACSVSSDNDLKIDVLKQLVELPPKYKSVVILYYYNEYSVKEISDILKISESAVKMRLKRGREILRLELEEYYK